MLESDTVYGKNISAGQRLNVLIAINWIILLQLINITYIRKIK